MTSSSPATSGRLLIVVSGRPGTGKTTLSKQLSQTLRACYLRVDAAEMALARLGGPVGVAGYAVVSELAVSNLELNAVVVVDAVSPVPEARAGWREAAQRAGATLLQVETILPDVVEHRRRVQARVADIPDHRVPTWDEVVSGVWTPWDEDRDGHRLRVHTTEAKHALAAVLRDLGRNGAQPLRAGTSLTTSHNTGEPQGWAPGDK